MEFPGGVWPVMLTPYDDLGNVDHAALRELVDWYIQSGVKGLFAVCQSSEMFFLNLDERIAITRTVVEAAGGRIPVIASGHVSDTVEEQVHELNEMAKTGIDALILITNRFAAKGEDDDLWMKNCTDLIKSLPPEIPLGFYECPYPYKRLLSLENIKACADTGRFYFLKDTCCDIGVIKERIKKLEGSTLKLYNANTTTLLESLKAGAAGYSGVMANFHPKLYSWLCDHYLDGDDDLELLQEFLTLASLIERQCYPVNAKYYLREYERLAISTVCRTKDRKLLTGTLKEEVRMLEAMTRRFEKKYIKTGRMFQKESEYLQEEEKRGEDIFKKSL